MIKESRGKGIMTATDESTRELALTLVNASVVAIQEDNPELIETVLLSTLEDLPNLEDVGSLLGAILAMTGIVISAVPEATEALQTLSIYYADQSASDEV